MVTKEDVERFLNHFHQKVEVFDIVFEDSRDKNKLSLQVLGLPPMFRIEVLKSLEYGDYSQGPIMDSLNGYGEMWVFGKDVEGHEIYIKISLGKPNSSTICISFHLAEYPIKYPFKD